MSHYPDNVGKLIVKLKNESDYVKLDEHLHVIPYRADELLTAQVFTYYASDRKRTIFNPAICVCIELNEVKFMSMLARTFLKLQDSDTPVVDLIEYLKIYPFILIINGRFIPWECINLIASYGKYYFFIHDLPSMDLTRVVRTVETMNLIILQSDVIYSIGVPTDNTPFVSFDEMGLYNETDWTHCIYYPSDQVGIKNLGEILSGITFTFGDEAKYKYFKENFFFWNTDGTYAPDAYMSFLGGLVEPHIPDDGTAYCIAVYNPNATPIVDNINKVDWSKAKVDIAYVLNDEDPPEYAVELSKPFELTMDRNLTYAENRQNAINYVLSYRTDLFYTLYELELDFFTLPVDYEWIQNHLDIDGALNIPRRSSLGRDYYIIVMQNCELYKYYKSHTYKANRFICPISGIEETDTIELLFFRNIDDYQFDTVFTEGEYLPLSYKYFNENTKLFCKETADTYFEFPADGNQHFPVPYTYETNDAGYRTVVMDSFYYGKTITVAPDGSFNYYGFFVDDQDAQYYKLNLGTHFYYCWDYDRYLVFYNGRRLNNSQYRMTVPCRTTTPFYEFEIYLAVPLSYGDRLDIFYLPNKIRDIEGALTLNEDGSIILEKSMLEYIAGPSLYTFWINGAKVPLLNLKDFNTYIMQLAKSGASLKNAVITKMGEGIEEVETVYQSIDETTWDSILRLYGDDAYSLVGLNKVTILDTDADAYAGAVPIVSIMWELIREHYIANALVDTTTAFIYDYLDQDQTAFDGVDQAGNDIIDAMNAEREDNLDIERYYP